MGINVESEDKETTARYAIRKKFPLAVKRSCLSSETLGFPIRSYFADPELLQWFVQTRIDISKSSLRISVNTPAMVRIRIPSRFCGRGHPYQIIPLNTPERNEIHQRYVGTSEVY